MLTSEYRIYTKKTRFIARKQRHCLRDTLVKKIAYKGLTEGYSGACLLGKSMKTSCELDTPSKLHLLKDLAGGVFEGGRPLSCGRAYAGISKLSKSLENHCCYQTANAVVIMLAVVEHKGSREKWWR